MEGCTEQVRRHDRGEPVKWSHGFFQRSVVGFPSTSPFRSSSTSPFLCCG